MEAVVVDADGVEDVGEFVGMKLHVNRRADDLPDFAFVHAIASFWQ